MLNEWAKKVKSGEAITITLDAGGEQVKLSPSRTVVACVLTAKGADTTMFLETLASTREICWRLGRAIAKNIVANAVGAGIIDLLSLCEMADAAFSDGMKDMALESLSNVADGDGVKEEK